MIKYALICDREHEFESWFPNADSFDTQARRGFVECPVCQSKKVSKALMAPSVSTSRRRARTRVAAAMEVAAAAKSAEAAPTPAPSVPVPAPAPMALLDEKQREMRAMIRELHQKLTENSTDVGESFPNEARAMHLGEKPQRSIHGKATLAEAKELAEEGIPVLPLPVPPDDRN
jgi:hypothetical protein